MKVEDEYSSWKHIPAGVPQGSVLGPLLFVIYTIDLPASCSNASTRCSQFADDTALISHHNSLEESTAALQSAVSSAAQWLSSWHLLVNATKTVVMSFQRGSNIHISLNGTTLQQVTYHRHLGLIIQSDLRWKEHIAAKIGKCRKALHHLLRVRGSIHRKALTAIYSTYIRPMAEYGTLALSNMSVGQQDALERLQRRAARICLRIPLFEPVHHSAILHKLNLHTLSSRRQYRQVLLGHALRFKQVPPHLQDSSLYRRAEAHHHDLRQQRTFALPATRTNRHRDSPINMAVHQFNSLPASLTDIPDIQAFKNNVQPLLLSPICSCSKHPTLTRR